MAANSNAGNHEREDEVQHQQPTNTGLENVGALAMHRDRQRCHQSEDRSRCSAADTPIGE